MITDLNERLERHKKWLRGKLGGERFALKNDDFRGVNLQDANLQAANLEKANLQGANLQGANLQGAYLYKANLHEVHLQRDNLEGTDLREANLHRANLREAYLRDANLQGANLQGADLRGAYLRYANLQGANLDEADLRGTNLEGANLRGANLQGTNLQGADLHEANLEGTKLPDFQKMPETGLVIGWKKVEEDIILMLEITGQRTCTLTSNVCRCSEAKVLEAFTSEGTQVQGITQFMSLRDTTFLYEIGKVVHVPNYDGDIRMMGAPGIHFFLTQQEAQNYYR